MIYNAFGYVRTMTKEEARRIIRGMLRRCKDVESPDYQIFTQPQYVALLTLINRNEEGRKYMAEEDY